MSEDRLPKLPREWKWIRLEEVSNITLGQSPPSSTYNIEGKGLPFFQGSGEFGKIYPIIKKWCTEPKKIANKGDILISVRAPVGDINIAPEKCAIGRGLAAISPIKPLTNKYFFYALKVFKEELKRKSTGSTFDAITGYVLKNSVIPLSPVAEQQKIVEILEEAFSKIDAGAEGLKKIKKLLTIYRKAVLKYAFEGKLTEKWREENKDKLEPVEELIKKIRKERKERYKRELEEWKKACEIAKKEGKKKPPKPKKPKDLPSITEEELQNLPQIPKEWVWVRLGNIAEITLGQSPPSSTYNTKGEGLPFFQGSGEFGKIYPTIKKWCIEPKKMANKGDILISVRAPVGDVNIAPGKCAIGRGLASISPINPLSNKYFFYAFKVFKDELKVKSTGSTFDAITGDVLKDFAIPLPFLSEQQRIVEEIEYRLSLADKLEETIDRLLKKTEKLKQSYLKYAFEGKLTEEWRKQNPHLITGENSVERLLETIMIEKEKFEKQKKGKNTRKALNRS